MKSFVPCYLFAVLLSVISLVLNTEAKPAVSHSRVMHLHKNKENFRERKCGVPRPELHYLGNTFLYIVN